MVLFPFHVTAIEYTDEQRRVYHDRSECPEAKKLPLMHRIDGTGGRERCKQCERIEGAWRSRRERPATYAVAVAGGTGDSGGRIQSRARAARRRT